MVNTTESATLRLNNVQKVVADVQKLNRALRSLNTTASALKRNLAGLDLNSIILRLSGRTPGLTRATNDLRNLNRQLTLLRSQASRPVNINVNRSGQIPGAGAPIVPGSGSGYGPGGGGRRNVLSTALAFGSAYMVIHGAVTIAGAGVRAAFEGQRADAAIDSTVVDPRARSEIRAAAEAAVLETRRISSIRADQIALDAYRAGARGSELSFLTGKLTQFESVAGYVSPGLNTECLTLLSNRVINLSNSLGDTVRQTEVLNGVFGAAVVAGESFNEATYLAALRTSGFAQTLNREGLVGLGLAVDSMGRQAGSGLNRLMKEMITPLSQAGSGAGIAKGAVRSLIASGIRGENGLTGNRLQQFQEDPLSYIQGPLADAITAKGVNLNDRAAVRTFLAQAGFSVTSQRVMFDALTSIEEATRAREVAGSISGEGLERLEGALANNMPAAIENLVAGFQTLSRSILTPLFEKWAPYVTALGDSMENLAKWFDQLSPAAQDNVLNLLTMASTVAAATVAIKAFGLAAGLLGGGRGRLAAGAWAGAAATAGRGLLARASPLVAASFVLGGGARIDRTRIDRTMMTGTDAERLAYAMSYGPQIPAGAGMSYGPQLPRRPANKNAAINSMAINMIPFNPEAGGLGGRLNFWGKQMESVIARLEQTNRAGAAGIIDAGTQASENLDGAFDSGTQRMMDASLLMGQNITDTMLGSSSQIGMEIAAYLEEALVRGASRARFQFPGGPRTNITTSADLGYSGSGDSAPAAAAATSAVGMWG